MIALIDEHMPVVTIAPHDHVFEKMIGSVQEAKAHAGADGGAASCSRTTSRCAAAATSISCNLAKSVTVE